jgi:hypothetical protein
MVDYAEILAWPPLQFGAELLGDFFYNEQFDETQRRLDEINRLGLEEYRDLDATLAANDSYALGGSNLAEETLAPEAVDQRFNQYLGGVNADFDALANRGRSLVNNLSDQNRRDVIDRSDREREGALSRLSSQGLGGSTIAPSVARGFYEDRDAELRRVNDQRLAQLLGVEQTLGLAGAQAGQAVGTLGFAEQGQAARDRLEEYRLMRQNQIQNRLDVTTARGSLLGGQTVTAPSGR